MTIRLSSRQSEFAAALGRFLVWIDELPGYRVTLGCARCQQPHHHPQSYHKVALAVDLNLFRLDDDGEWTYLTATEDHLELGRKWEELGGTWGGRFRAPDGNHYSWGEGRRQREQEPEP